MRGRVLFGLLVLLVAASLGAAPATARSSGATSMQEEPATEEVEPSEQGLSELSELAPPPAATPPRPPANLFTNLTALQAGCLIGAWGEEAFQAITTFAQPMTELDRAIVIQCGVLFSAEPEVASPPAGPSATTAPTPPATASPEASPATAPTATPTLEPTALPTPGPRATPTAEDAAVTTAVPTPEPTATPTSEPSPEPTATLPSTPTAEPTATLPLPPAARPTQEPTASPPPATPTPQPPAPPANSPTPPPTATRTTLPARTPSSEPAATPPPPVSLSPLPSPKPLEPEPDPPSPAGAEHAPPAAPDTAAPPPAPVASEVAPAPSALGESEMAAAPLAADPERAAAPFSPVEGQIAFPPVPAAIAASPPAEPLAPTASAAPVVPTPPAAVPPDLVFIPDPGVRVPDAASPVAAVDASGVVFLRYYDRAHRAELLASAADGLRFGPGVRPTGFASDPRRVRLPDGTWRIYLSDPIYKVMTSLSSADGVAFTADPGVRYRPQPGDNGTMGAYTIFPDGGGGMVLLYVGDLQGLNNARRAYSPPGDNGWSFTFDREDVLGDAALGGGLNSYGDINSAVRLPDGRVRLFSVRQGSVYSFASADDGATFSLEPGVRLAPAEFRELRVGSLHDPWVVRLKDGRYRMYVVAEMGDPSAPRSVLLSATTPR